MSVGRLLTGLRAGLILGDLTALVLFVYLGQREHELVNPVNPAWGVLSSTLVFAGPWFASGLWLGAFPAVLEASRLSLGRFLSRSLNAWLVAALLGLLLRSWLLGRAVIPTVFLVATLGFGGLLVLGWRLLLAVAVSLNTRRLRARAMAQGRF